MSLIIKEYSEQVFADNTLLSISFSTLKIDKGS